MRLPATLLLIAASAATSRTAAQSASEAPPIGVDAASGFAVEIVLDGLDHPAGLAYRTGTAEGDPPELYFSESGAGRVMRVQLAGESEVTPVVAGFPTRPCAALGGATVGPLGLAFLTRTKLAVGEGGAGPGADLLRVYVLDGGDAAQGYADFDHSVGPIQAGRKIAFGSLFGVGVIDDAALFVSALSTAKDGADAAPVDSYLLKVAVEANEATDVRRFVRPRDADATGLSAVTVHPAPASPYVVIGFQGAADESPDSVIAYYSPQSGRQALALPCGLRDVTALAFSADGQLYAADASWADPTAAGVYRLDAATVDGRQACRPVKIAALPRPVALAFGPGGELFVAAWGESDDPAAGAVLRITGEL